MKQKGAHVQFWSDKYASELPPKERNELALLLYEWGIPIIIDLTGDGTTENTEKTADGAYALRRIKELMDIYGIS